MNKKRLSTRSDEKQSTDSLTIAVRAFVPLPPEDGAPAKRKKRKKSRPMAPPSNWALIFDSETTVDAAQQLRVGGYQVRHGDERIRAGLFFDPASLKDSETKLLRKYCGDHALEFMTVAQFIGEIFFGVAYDRRATIVGFNLPFDLSRLAIRHGAARSKTMRGGFTFRLSPNPYRPAIQVRHLNSRASLIQFAHPPKRRDKRRDRRNGRPSVERRGSFIDLKTIAAALTSRSFNLASLADFLATPLRKTRTDEHGALLTHQYLEYLVRDVEVTWQCYCALRQKFDGLRLTETHMGKILSEASLGKAHFQQMAIQSFGRMQSDFPDSLTGRNMSAYFGGRSEVRWRRTVKQVLYCDFLSMYPTVCTLMELWRFVIAQGVTWADTTESTREFIEGITLSDLKRPETWKLLTTIVRAAPNEDIFPVRAKYDGKSHTIGLNFLTAGISLWFTLADVIAAKILTGKTPNILEAISFSPLEPQIGLRPVSIAGNANYQINPITDDFFKRLIDLRTAVKRRMASAVGAERDTLDAEQQALKILANSTAYGIYFELNVSELDDFKKRGCFGPSGASFEIETNKSEEQGSYFHPLLAVLITGAARLKLAIAERLVADAGLDWAFCDTDSMAIAKPDDMQSDEFLARARSIGDWFTPLNPYDEKGPIFRIEKENFKLGTNPKDWQFEPLYCYCISSKRYALFNLGKSGEIIIRKASAHGLGHLRPPYGPEDAPNSIPVPAVSLDEIGVERWHYDIWHQIIRADRDGHPDQVDLDYHPGLNQPAVSRYGATTPTLLKWFKTFNANRLYRDQVKPFNFLNSFFARPQREFSEIDEHAIGKPGRRRKIQSAKPVAPFDKDVARAARNAFDRETGRPVPTDTLMTYKEALAQYHLRPESKFLTGDFVDRGRTERRHVRAVDIVHIGKEANKWEEQFFTGPDEEAQIEYGADASGDLLDERLRKLCKEFGQREATRRLGISRLTLAKALAHGCAALSRSMRARIGRG